MMHYQNKGISMQKTKNIYFSELLHKCYPKVFNNLKSILNKHGYKVNTLKNTKDIWIRDFMPLSTKDGLFQYIYTPDYLNNHKDIVLRTDPNECISELKLTIKKINLVIDGGNMLMFNDTIIMTDKIYTENPLLKHDTKALESFFHMFKKVIVIPRDPHIDEIYGHADGMVRFISENHLLVNSQYPETFKRKLHARLKETGFKITELKMNKDTKYTWGYINFLHIDNLIIQPSIDKMNDNYVKEQFENLYPDATVELCDARPLVKKGGVFNCVTWEL
ncbi:MAG: agmatine deiminase family protein [Bacteroidales bacterium]|nr:agmatine deiminase family protein [Bacteroidales bacterium]